VAVTIAMATVVLDQADDGDQDRLEIVSGGEVARRVGISRERVRQLAEAHQLPAPAAVLRRDRGWRWGDILDWAQLNDRRLVGRWRRGC
jgi:predicted DNA-binding transcriptional regulator AlpA